MILSQEVYQLFFNTCKAKTIKMIHIQKSVATRKWYNTKYKTIKWHMQCNNTKLFQEKFRDCNTELNTNANLNIKKLPHN